MNTCQRIRALRKARGWTRYHLVCRMYPNNRVGQARIVAQTMRKWETSIVPCHQVLWRLSEIYGIDIDYLRAPTGKIPNIVTTLDETAKLSATIEQLFKLNAEQRRYVDAFINGILKPNGDDHESTGKAYRYKAEDSEREQDQQDKGEEKTTFG